MKTTYKHLESFAKTQQLCVSKYNSIIKIFKGENIDYFSGDGLGSFLTIREAYAFVQGYQQARNK